MEQCPSLLIQFTVKWNYSERGIRRWGGEDFEQNAIPFGSCQTCSFLCFEFHGKKLSIM